MKPEIVELPVAMLIQCNHGAPNGEYISLWFNPFSSGNVFIRQKLMSDSDVILV